MVDLDRGNQQRIWVKLTNAVEEAINEKPSTNPAEDHSDVVKGSSKMKATDVSRSEMLEITISVPFDEFDDEKKKIVQEAIGAFLDIPRVEIIQTRRGSVKVIIQLNSDQAGRLREAILSGYFAEYNIVDAHFIEQKIEEIGLSQSYQSKRTITDESNLWYIITADDYGVTPIIDDAIEEAIELGIVTSVAAFSNLKDSQQNFRAEKVAGLKRRFGDKVSVGLHLTITSGSRVYPERSKLGRRWPNRHKFRDFKEQPAEGATVEDIEKELWAQIEAFEAAEIEPGLPLEIAHFSDHHGIIAHTEKGLEALVNVVAQYNESRGRQVPIRNPMYIGTLVSNPDNDLYISLSDRARPLIVLANRKHKNPEEIKHTRRELREALGRIHARNIPTTDFYVESYYGVHSEDILTSIFDSSNYDPERIGDPRYSVHVPFTSLARTVEIVVHLGYGEVSGPFSPKKYREMVAHVKEYGGIDTNYLRYHRPEELANLKKYFAKNPGQKNNLITLDSLPPSRFTLSASDERRDRPETLRRARL